MNKEDGSEDVLRILDSEFGDPLRPREDAPQNMWKAYVRKVEEYSSEMLLTLKETKWEGEDL